MSNKAKANKPAAKKPAAKKPAAKKPAAVVGASPPTQSRGGASMTDKKKSGRRGGAGKGDMLTFAAPAGVAALGPKILTMIQKPDGKQEAADDKTAMALAAGAWWMNGQPKYRKYASSVLVLAAMAFRRQKVLAGEMSTDAADTIIAESAVAKK